MFKSLRLKQLKRQTLKRKRKENKISIKRKLKFIIDDVVLVLYKTSIYRQFYFVVLLLLFITHNRKTNLYV